ncbi:MAG: hypothetical protein WCK51_04935 [Armatimonadota bacterium]
MLPIERDINTLEAVASSYWGTYEGQKIIPTEKEEVLQTARVLLLDYQYREGKLSKHGKAATRETFFWRILTYATRIRRTELRLKREISDPKTPNMDRDLERFSQELGRVGLPLEVSQQATVFLGLEVGDLRAQSARYKVEFIGKTDLASYIVNPGYVPEFELVPHKDRRTGREIFAEGIWGKTRGKKRLLGKEDLSEEQCLVLSQRRIRIANYIKDALPEFLQLRAWTQLPEHYKRVIRAYNRGESPSEIQDHLGIRDYTYKSYIRALEGRGWYRTHSVTSGKPIIHYFPARDGVSSISSAIRELGSFDRHAIIALSKERLSEKLREGLDDPGLIASAIELEKLERLKLKIDPICFENHDLKLRKFICQLVDRPIRIGVDIAEVERRLGRLDRRRKLAIFARAVSSGDSIWECIQDDFVATFIDDIRDFDEAFGAEPQVDLATLLRVIRTGRVAA